MTIYFTPPIHPGLPVNDFDPFFKRFSVMEGVSVVRNADQTYSQRNYITLDDELDLLAAGGKIYRGGYQHEITAAEQTALTAAGYGAYITVV